MTNRETKIAIKDFFKTRDDYYRETYSGWVVTRCPFCGDSQTNNNTGHFYIKIDEDSSYAVGYNCFKCGEHGRLNQETLEAFDAPSELKQMIGSFNKNAKSYDKTTDVNTEKLLYFDYKIPKFSFGEKTEYINNRLNKIFSERELLDMKVITSLNDFINLNGIKSSIYTSSQIQLLEKKYVGFMSNGNSHILFRDITEKENSPWVKYPISKDSIKNRVFYSISEPIDVFTQDNITINLSEGVFDCLGVAYNFDLKNENVMNIALTGKYYSVMIYRLINLGLVGSNITINIYSDSDWLFNTKKSNYNVTLDYYKKELSKFKPLYKKINIYYNMKKKDFGYPKSEIVLEKHII